MRDKRRDDVEADFEWRKDPELAALDATKPIRLTLDEYDRYFFGELNSPSPWSVKLAIDTLHGIHIGNIMYYDIDPIKRQAELGIMVGNRDYWGQGCGSDAIQSLLQYIFHDTELDRIYLHTLVSNHRAQASFKKCGFVEVRRLRRDGYDFVFMEVWREPWLQEIEDKRPADLT